MTQNHLYRLRAIFVQHMTKMTVSGWQLWCINDADRVPFTQEADITYSYIHLHVCTDSNCRCC